MNQMTRRLDKLSRKLADGKPSHDLSPAEEDAFFAWLPGWISRQAHQTIGKVVRSEQVASMSDRDLWQILMPTVAEWKAQSQCKLRTVAS